MFVFVLPHFFIRCFVIKDSDKNGVGSGKSPLKCSNFMIPSSSSKLTFDVGLSTPSAIKRNKLALICCSGLRTSRTLFSTICVRRGASSMSAVSWGSLYQFFIWIPFSGYNMKHSGVLSMIMVLSRGRPSLDKSFT